MSTVLIKDIRYRWKELNYGSPWYGRSLDELIHLIDGEYFTHKIEGYPHSIQGLFGHILVWRGVLLQKLDGHSDYTIKLNTPQDWPSRPSLTKHVVLTEIKESYTAILNHLKNKDDVWLKKKVPGEKFTFKFMIEGVIQHDLYHLGQIMILYKIFKG